jgi:hypothetical protein
MYRHKEPLATAEFCPALLIEGWCKVGDDSIARGANKLMRGS